jgi:hypothetical protein
MSSLAQNHPAEKTVSFDGAVYRLPVLALAELRKIQSWLNGLKSPLARFNDYASELPDDIRQNEMTRISQEMAHWPPKIGSTEASLELTSLDGLDLVLRLMLRKGQPGLDDAKLETIVGSLLLRDLKDIINHAFGVESTSDEEPSDPKSDSPSIPMTLSLGTVSSEDFAGVTGGLQK